MLCFEPYSPEILKKYLPYIRRSPYLTSDISAGFLFMWEDGADLGFCVWNDTFVIREEIGGLTAFSWPYGADPDGMIDGLMEYTEARWIPLRFFGVDDELIGKIKSDGRLSPVMAGYERRWSDYIYSFEGAATFSGKKFSGQRNHINKYTKLYGTPVVRAMTPDDLPAVLSMLEEYKTEHPDGGRLEQIELDRTKALLDVYSEFGMYAACLVCGGEIAAISIGEVIGDMLIITVEKALRRFEGAYPTMYQGFVRYIQSELGHPLVTVNRMDDSGDAGIRTSKQQYQPTGMVNKYLVNVDCPAARAGDLPSINAGRAYLTPFREEDKSEYFRLSTDDGVNRWWGYDYRDDVNVPYPPTEDAFYESVRYDMEVGDSVNFAVRLSENSPMIGEAILWDFTRDSAEIGCRLLPEHQHMGIGTSAFGAAADYAANVLGVKVRARCMHPNEPSHRMILACGFHETSRDGTYIYFER